MPRQYFLLAISKKSRGKIASFIFGFLAMFVFFLAGFFHNDTKIEKCASYASDVVISHTRKGEYSSLIVEPNEPEIKLQDSETEFYSLYGIFAESKVTFAPLYNADKKFDIHIKGVESSSLSILYGGGVRTIEYKGHYKHRVYPIEVMFEDFIYFYDLKYVVYISQKQADSILLSNGIKPGKEGFSQDDYHSLLEKRIIITIDSIDYEYLIQNIYFNENYYYDALTEVVNDFVITSYYSYDVTKDHLQHVYFLKSFEYQNYYMMRYINNLYDCSNYSLTVGKENLINNINENKVVSFYYSDDYHFILSPLLMVLSFIFLAISFLIFFVFSYDKIRDFVFLSVSLFSPYLVLRIISIFFPHSSFFSFYSLKINMFVLVAYILIAILFAYFRKNPIKFIKRSEKKYDEIDV